MKTLVISGSIRSKESATDYISELVSEVDALQEYTAGIKKYQTENDGISNSDILAGAALIAMKSLGADISYFPLIKLFPRKEKKIAYTGGNVIDPELALTDTLALNKSQLDDLLKRVEEADGVVLVTPVYFGDRSSVANKLLQITGINNLLHDKVFGCISVGAKRNGGQETTIIYSLFEALNQSALVVGNGPPTSQYGGTAVGGKKGTVIDDDWGLETAFGTGRGVAHVSRVLKEGRDGDLGRPVKITILVTMDDTKGALSDYLEAFISRVRKDIPNIVLSIEYVLDSTIYRCVACDKCPSDDPLPLGQRPTKENRPLCIIQNSEDAMERIRDVLLDSDGIVIAGLNVEEHEQLLYRYQVMTERTRYIRRDHFELTGKVITSFSLNQVGARINSLHSLKTLTSYIRHNAIMHKPIEAFVYNGQVIEDGMDDFTHFVRSVETVVKGQEKVESIAAEYTTKGIGGY